MAENKTKQPSVLDTFLLSLNNVGNKSSNLLIVASALLTSIAATLLGMIFLGGLFAIFSATQFLKVITWETESYRNRFQSPETQRVREIIRKPSVIISTGALLLTRLGMILLIGGFLKPQLFPEPPALIASPHLIGVGLFLGGLSARFISSSRAYGHIEKAKELLNDQQTEPGFEHELPNEKLISEKLINTISLEAITVGELQNAQATVMADSSAKVWALLRPNGSPLTTSYLASHLNLELGNLNGLEVITKADALALLDYLANSPATPEQETSERQTFSTGKPVAPDSEVFDFEQDPTPRKNGTFLRFSR